MKHESVCSVKLGNDVLGNITRLNNLLEGLPQRLEEAEQKLSTVQQQLVDAKAEVGKPFPKETELNQMLERLSELNAMLNMDEKGEDIQAEEIPEAVVAKGKPSIHDRLESLKKQTEQTGFGAVKSREAEVCV